MSLVKECRNRRMLFRIWFFQFFLSNKKGLIRPDFITLHDQELSVLSNSQI